MGPSRPFPVEDPEHAFLSQNSNYLFTGNSWTSSLAICAEARLLWLLHDRPNGISDVSVLNKALSSIPRFFKGSLFIAFCDCIRIISVTHKITAPLILKLQGFKIL